MQLVLDPILLLTESWLHETDLTIYQMLEKWIYTFFVLKLLQVSVDSFLSLFLINWMTASFAILKTSFAISYVILGGSDV